MFGLFKNKQVANAHGKITQLIQMVSHAANIMGRDSAINVLRRHELVRDWHERSEFGRADYSFAFDDRDVGDFLFTIEGDAESENESFAINIHGGILFAGFYGRASIPTQKYIVSAKDTPRYSVTSQAKSLVNFFVQRNDALDTSPL